MREYQLGLGLLREQVYNQTMNILLRMLVLGLICNLLVKPVADKWFMADAESAAVKRLVHELVAAAEAGMTDASGSTARASSAVVALAWLVSASRWPWGVYKTLIPAAKFFN